MRVGKPKKVNWNNLIAPNFKPYLEAEDGSAVKGSCGTHALSVLTGLSTKYISKKLKGKSGYWTDRSLLDFLRKRKFKIEPITIGSTCSYLDYSSKKKISPLHVILYSCYVCKEEATWAVLYKHMEYHSGEVEPFFSVQGFNYPIWTAYVIWHPEWGLKELKDIDKIYGWDYAVKIFYVKYIEELEKKLKKK